MTVPTGVRCHLRHWTQQLTGARAPQSVAEWLTDDAARVRSVLGCGALTWAVEVGEDVAACVAKRIPVLATDASFMASVRRATTSTPLRILMLLAEIDGCEESLASTELSDIAREFARRGLKLDDLLKAIRVGYAVLAAAFLDAADTLLPPAQSAAELRRISVMLFEMNDDFTAEAVASFLREQSAWIAGISAARLEVVNQILDNAEVSRAHAEDVLGYPLDGPHVAVVAWGSPNSRRDLRPVVNAVLQHRGAQSASLVLPVGLRTVWAWGTANAPQRRDLPSFEDVHVVVGQTSIGVDGFRQSHREAKSVERLIRLRPTSSPRTVAHADVALEVLLMAEPESARTFAERILGELAGGGERMRVLRSTLGHYLDLDHSLSKVAAVEQVSKNTVTYRINKALRLCGYDGATSTDLRAALRIHNWLSDPAADGDRAGSAEVQRRDV
ncbi:helix-turn-helix domain-containing protein [Pseudonocardia sp. NPDC049635]|uniref:PucR family transcriptional regulator n=1 Tax=Pseudonocardia sp. NPDC049635 TaxID=3155506 RepID=UPI0033C6559E